MTRLLLVSMLMLPALCCAEGGRESYTALDFALYLSEHKLPLAYPSGDIDTRIKRLGISWQEHYGERLRLALLGGYSFVTQTGNPATAGLELDGYHVGVAFDADLVEHRPFTLFVAGTYLYERTKESVAAQNVTLSWSEPSARLGARIRLPGGFRVEGGAQYGYVDGQERLSGTTNQSTDIERRRAAGGFAAIDVAVDSAGGYVGIAGQSRPERGARIYFGRKF